MQLLGGYWPGTGLSETLNESWGKCSDAQSRNGFISSSVFQICDFYFLVLFLGHTRLCAPLLEGGGTTWYQGWIPVGRGQGQHLYRLSAPAPPLFLLVWCQRSNPELHTRQASALPGPRDSVLETCVVFGWRLLLEVGVSPTGVVPAVIDSEAASLCGFGMSFPETMLASLRQFLWICERFRVFMFRKYSQKILSDFLFIQDAI